MNWFELTVENVQQASDEAMSVSFTVSAAVKETFNWWPGQHIRIQLPIDGERISRSYSISSPLGEPLQITVKKVKNGKGSGYINSNVSVGDKFLVTAPMGRFILKPEPNARRSYYFFAAGSGITPIYSMLVSMLQNEPDSHAYLLYGNKDNNSTIFADELSQLQQKYSNRFTLCHCHSSPSWFSSSPWRSGRIDAAAIQDFIQQNPPYAQDAQYFLCGPGSFLPDVKKALNDIDVPNSRIHMESFGGKSLKSECEGVAAELQVDLHRQQHQIQAEKGQSLLQAMLSQGIEAPYSCEGGICGTCRCKLVSGEVNMTNNAILEQSELDNGEILACQSFAKTPTITVTYDEA